MEEVMMVVFCGDRGYDCGGLHGGDDDENEGGKNVGCGF